MSLKPIEPGCLAYWSRPDDPSRASNEIPPHAIVNVIERANEGEIMADAFLASFFGASIGLPAPGNQWWLVDYEGEEHFVVEKYLIRIDPDEEIKNESLNEVTENDYEPVS